MTRNFYSGFEALDYTDSKIVLGILRNIDLLESYAIYKEDPTASSIMTDMSLVVQNLSSILTDKQLEVFNLVVFSHKTEEYAAKELGITQQAIHYRLKYGLDRVINFLTENKRTIPRISKEDTKRLIQLYLNDTSIKEIAIELNLPTRRVSNKIRYLRRKKLIRRKGDEKTGGDNSR